MDLINVITQKKTALAGAAHNATLSKALYEKLNQWSIFDQHDNPHFIREEQVR